MNWNPARHETLEATDWSSSRAREAIGAIIDDVEGAWDPQNGWPAHPRDNGSPSHRQYSGTAGVITGLVRMCECIDRSTRLPLVEIGGLLQAQTQPQSDHPSLLMGRTGRQLAAYRVEPSDENATRVLQAIRANDESVEHELMWGLAGTIAAAAWMYDTTGDERFARAAHTQVSTLWDAWQKVDDESYLWVQDLYRRRQYYLGAAHGQVGNLHAIWAAKRRWPGLVDGEKLLERTVDLVETTAVEGPDGVNWPPVLNAAPEPLQWCHGAPGFVTALDVVPPTASGRLDELLVDAAELIWRAGPLRKGHNLCHGTAGNGWALLKMWRRTGDEIWLQRARRFAMHAIGQRERICEEFGRGWYSLWTGDVGLGVYLCACLEKSTPWVGWEEF